MLNERVCKEAPYSHEREFSFWLGPCEVERPFIHPSRSFHYSQDNIWDFSSPKHILRVLNGKIFESNPNIYIQKISFRAKKVNLPFKVLSWFVVDDILKLVLLFFRENKNLTFHVTHPPSRQFTSYVNSYFL